MRATRHLPLYGLLALTAALASSGCEPDKAEASSLLDNSSAALSPDRTTGTPDDIALERRLKAAAAGPLAVVRPTPLPLLLPDDPALREVAQIIPGDDWYAVAMVLDDIAVSLNATRVVQRLPVPLEVAVEMPTRQAPRVTLSEATPALTFEEGGVSWLLIVECASPFADPRCTDEAFIRNLADGLTRIEEGAP